MEKDGFRNQLRTPFNEVFKILYNDTMEAQLSELIAAVSVWITEKLG